MKIQKIAVTMSIKSMTKEWENLSDRKFDKG